MEDSGVPPAQPKDRSRPRQFARPGSKSSMSSTKSRINPQSANSSTSHLASSPQSSTPSHSHRYHHSLCTNHKRGSGSERTRSLLSREASEELDQNLPAVSSFLQERLQRERKAESGRSTSRTSNDAMSASLDLRAIQSSPIRAATFDYARPRSSEGDGEPAKKKDGMGLKDVEQVC